MAIASAAQGKTEKQNPTLPDDLAPLRDEPFIAALDDLEQLLSQRHRAFLFGAGCSKCAGLPLMDGLTAEIRQKILPDAISRDILEALAHCFQGADRPNIEDYMSELVDFMTIAQRRSQRRAVLNTVSIGEKIYQYEDLATAHAEIKGAIRDCLQGPLLNLEHHRRFVRAVHSTLQSGKTGPKSPVDYFLLNYDTLIEDALALEQISFSDGFRGGSTGWWDSRTFADKGLDARVLKLHGGIDWRLLKNDALPRRIRPDLVVLGEEDPVMIWPASTKYRETQRDPYAQVIGILRKTLRPPENSEVILTIAGYAFGDSHINLEIEAALRESSERLTCLVFTQDERPEGELHRWVTDTAIAQRIRVYSRRGFFHATDERVADGDLPWWKFEVLARLLRGER